MGNVGKSKSSCSVVYDKKEEKKGGSDRTGLCSRNLQRETGTDGAERASLFVR